ncbi:hypothetical protein Tco_1492632 [Tanacetum coccineum]
MLLSFPFAPTINISMSMLLAVLIVYRTSFQFALAINIFVAILVAISPLNGVPILYVVPTGKDMFIVSAGRTKVIPVGSTILVLGWTFNPCILVGYSTQSKGYRVYNKNTRLIVESIHLRFDKIKEMSETSVANDTSGLVPQRQKASDYDNSDPVPQLQNVSPSADTIAPSQQELELLFGPLYNEFFSTGTSRVNKSSSPIDNSAQQDT